MARTHRGLTSTCTLPRFPLRNYFRGIRIIQSIVSIYSRYPVFSCHLTVNIHIYIRKHYFAFISLSLSPTLSYDCQDIVAKLRTLYIKLFFFLSFKRSFKILLLSLDNKLPDMYILNYLDKLTIRNEIITRFCLFRLPRALSRRSSSDDHAKLDRSV